MTRALLPFLVPPILLVLAGCPKGGGGSGGFEATGSTPSVVYTANGGANTLSGFTIGTAGALTATTPATFSTSGSNTEWVAVSPSGQFLYSSNQNSATVSGFTVNATTGNLTPTAPATFSTGAGSSPRGVAITPNAQFLYERT